MLAKGLGCQGCVLEQIGTGFMETCGSGRNGVLLVGEALGSNEVIAGHPFAGRAGMALDKMLQRGGMNRDDFKISNVIYCQPPDNKLSGMWYMEDAINHCRPYLDKAIEDMKPKCIVALGAVAARRLIPDLPVGILEARGYTFWSKEFNTWVMLTVHPSFVMRGKTGFAQVLIHDIQRAVEIAKEGYSYHSVDYSLDVTPLEASRWVDEFEEYYSRDPELYLSTDIETPEKDANEEDLDLEDGSDYIILRCGYSYREGNALSIPWDGSYRHIHERLLRHQCQKLFWNAPFDVPRLYSQKLDINGPVHDAMDAWHILNSDLKKSLGFVTPFFYHGQKMWKHLSNQEPAYYNAVDADAAGVNMRGTVALLKQHGMWKIYNEFISELDPVFSAMTRAGMPIDISRRIQSSKELIRKRNDVREKIESIIPTEIKNLSPKNGYVREPKDTSGMVEVVFDGVKRITCPNCGTSDPKKTHFKQFKRKPNPCGGFEPVQTIEGTKRWARVEPFIPSSKGIIRYQQYHNHPLMYKGRGKDKKVTADEKAIKKLINKYPKDEFYPLTLDNTEYNTIGGRYIGWWDEDTQEIIGGMPTGRDGRIHGIFRHTPSTLRSSMVSPNLQNIPRGDDSDVQKWVKQMFVTPNDFIFLARDFSGIEAQLVGVHAGDREFLRLAKIDIHSYFTAHNLYSQGILLASDIPDLKWSDSDLRGYLKGIKKRFYTERNIGKRCVHAGNYRVGPGKLHEEYPKWFPRVKDATMALGLFYEVFPSISKWHWRICKQIDKSVAFHTSFGHILRFYQVLNWSKVDGEWVPSFGDDAKRLIAAGPQSDAALIIKRALKRCYYNYPESMALWLRLMIHDEILTECPKNRADEADSILQFEMERPTPEIILDPSWGFGNNLCIESEGWRASCWGDK